MTASGWTASPVTRCSPGPSVYARLGERAWISALWNAQIAGRAKNDPRSLDLTNFERHLVKVRLGIQF